MRLKALPEIASKITFYHAELEPQVREQRHRDWNHRRIKLIIATVAFGMGINKPDVRYVITFTTQVAHALLPRKWAGGARRAQE